ncbi:hypothetical protein ASZ90_010371 [hydrocarbon metagenome]|uniref:Potassium channel domain-containing protein n=1 Tax=hydrocarbon metagenome TaxID=938273 RepID=A0A0W8FGA8_9ZZZZ
MVAAGTPYFNNGRLTYLLYAISPKGEEMDAAIFRFRIYLLVLTAVIAGGVAGFMLVEGLSPLDALYFVVVSIATVGYGDIHPATDAGKALVVIFILAGVGTFVAAAGSALEMMMAGRERRDRFRKMNMLIGVFFSEAGTGMLRYLASRDPDLAAIREDLIVTAAWSERDYARVCRRLKDYAYRIDMQQVDLEAVRRFLDEKRGILLQLLQNPALLEHDDFAGVLSAVFHLTEELEVRDDLTRLPAMDVAHLRSDTERIYRLLTYQWLAYMKHLKEHFPYLYSLALRTNPFDENASPVIR